MAAACLTCCRRAPCHVSEPRSDTIEARPAITAAITAAAASRIATAVPVSGSSLGELRGSR
jgi:hypothetical protein